MLSTLFKKIFGTAQTRKVNKYLNLVALVNKEEVALQQLTDIQLKEKTALFKKRLEAGETTDDILVEAYAVVKNTCRRLMGKEIHVSGYDQKWDMIPYDVQIAAAIAMHHGAISEMQTGEGKTLTAALPIYLHALTKKAVHLVTVNDYLAKRDVAWVGEIFRWHNLSIRALTNDTPPDQRKEVYNSDIVYGTASEFGFDYLRDNSMATMKEEQCQRGYYFAVIDEIDSILIDEARTPLIISGPARESKQMYDELKTPVLSIVKKQLQLCTKLADQSKKTLEKLGLLSQVEEKIKLSKEDNEIKMAAIKDLWLVSKGAPIHKTLRLIKENPDMRFELETIETYFYAEPNKEERLTKLGELYVTIDEKNSDYELTDKGIQESEESAVSFTMLDLGEEYALIDNNNDLSDEEKMKKKIDLREEDSTRKEKAHNTRQLFRAHLLMAKDVDYIIKEKKIVIIDENTGRAQPGRRFSDGLHQAIEAKENLKVQGESQTYAQVTLQNYFRLYDRLSGMTGTAITEASEFKATYGLEVLCIPTNKKCVRKDNNDLMYMTEREKYNAIVEEIKELHEQGRPILLGTESVDASEKISKILKSHNLKFSILNAKNHEKEAEIIALAGSKGAITVATNMAGRGTDIKLGDGVANIGGLHVLGTTRHQSRRIDRQLRGRCGRQGDPGSSRFYVSFEDELMRLFNSSRFASMLQKMRPPEGEAIEANILNRSIETAQKRIEQRNFSYRKHTLEYDDVMNKQRTEVYQFRNRTIHAEDPFEVAFETLTNITHEMAHSFLETKDEPGKWQPEEFRKTLTNYFPVSIKENAYSDDYMTREDIAKDASLKVIHAFKRKLQYESRTLAAIQKASKQEVHPVPILHNIIRSMMIKSIDSEWQKHLLHIDHLRTEVNMRTVAQKDPLMEFKHESFRLFSDFRHTINKNLAKILFSFGMMPPEDPKVRDRLAALQNQIPLNSFIPLEKV